MQQKLVGWNGRSAFVCAFTLILSALIINYTFRIAYLQSSAFAHIVVTHSHLTENIMIILRGALWIGLPYVFSRMNSLRHFAAMMGLSRGIKSSGIGIYLLGVGAGLLSLELAVLGLQGGDAAPSVYLQDGFLVRSIFLFHSLILFPLVEEYVFRGYIYRAFRGSYNFPASALLTLCVDGYFHYGLIISGFVALVVFVSVHVTLCMIREKSGNLWYCILFHAAHNAAVYRQWVLLLTGLFMIAGIYWCADSRRRTRAIL